MRPGYLLKSAIATLFLVLGIIASPTHSLAAGGEISAFFGTNTVTTISSDQNTATASGDGVGGTVKYNNNNLVNGTIPGWTTSSDIERNIVVTPAAGYQIVWIKVWRRGQSWSNEDVDTPASGATSFQRSIKEGRKYYVAVKFEAVSASYSVSYTIAADNPAGTTCNATGKPVVTPASPQTVLVNANPSFTITNTDTSCQLDSINFDNSGWSTTGIVGNVYTTPDITKNVSFQIRYKGHSYTITSTVDTSGASSCGTISPPTQAYISGSNQIFTIVKNIGCGIESVLVDGSNVTSSVTSAANTYTFNNIQANHSISVKFVKTTSTTGTSYCQVPSFMKGQSSLKPNVLIVFDTSGSMGENPYSGKTYDCTETGAKSTLAACSKFYGYFEPGTMYKLKANSTTDYLIDTTATLNLASKNGTGIGKGLSGNFLNYTHMRKVDIIRKILIGGQVDAGAGSARGSASGNNNTRWLITDNNKRVEYGTSDPQGLIHKDYDLVRFGMMVFNDNGSNVGTGDGGRISAPFGSSLATLVSQIESTDTDPGGYTPLAESLYEALRYYRGTTSAYNSGVDYGNTTTYPVISPFTRHAIQASCQKSFILVITDGEPTNDGNIPGSSGSNITDTNFTTWASAMGTPAPTTLMGKVAYYGHTKDLLDLTKVNTDISNINNVSIYTVFTFDSAANGVTTLKEASRFGSFVETSTAHNGKPDVLTEYTSSNGTITNNYYQADDGEVLEASLSNALSKIISSTASGTAAAVANNKSGERGANIIQALFYPQWPGETEDGPVKWLGEMQALWYYLDPIISYSGIFQDSDGDKELNLLKDKAPPSNSFETKSLWRAGAQLQKMAAADRKIYTPLTSAALTDSTNEFKIPGTTADLEYLRQRMNLGLETDSGAVTNTQAGYIINYIRGVDRSEFRPRKVSFMDPVTAALNTALPTEWKLGDIINSTPQVQSSIPLNSYDKVYDDAEYRMFINTNDYKNRNVVYTSSNDGMLHAFRLGKVTNINSSSEPQRVAKIAGTDMGKEEWAFIPQNAQPYLQNQAGIEYCHQCLVDGGVNLFDASIAIPSSSIATCGVNGYEDCTRKTAINSSNDVVWSDTSWKTVLINSMGLGGASRDMNSTCNETLNHDSDATNNRDCVKTPKADIGLSSYFALDVSDPLVPKLMWEFSDYSIALDPSISSDKVAVKAAQGLGFTTPGSAIMRTQPVDASGNPVPKRNGRWFAVFASGPTGALGDASHPQQFTGRSDQNLKLYIVDLNATMPFRKDINYWVKDTGIKYAFANSLSGAVIDLDRWNKEKFGYYSDDVAYISYTKASLDSSGYPTAWDKGGVTRLVTNNDRDPANWFVSSLIDDTGPITSSIGKILDRDRGKMWVYFGEGRYFYAQDEVNTTRKFYGIQDPCYNNYSKSNKFAMETTAAACTAFNTSYLQDQGGTPPAVSLDATSKGWYITMDAASGTKGAERIVSDVTAAMNGIVFYTTFTPNTDVCTPGGTTAIWAVKYDTGGIPPTGSLVGKAPVQTSSGGITVIDMSTDFTEKSGRKTNSAISAGGVGLQGVASGKGIRPLLLNKGIKKITHMQEQ